MAPPDPIQNHTALERAQIEIQRRKSHEYRALYSKLLEKHQATLQKAWSLSNETEESRLIQTMWVSERNAIAMGLFCACATLAIIRFGTPVFVRRVGGEDKLIQWQKRDEEAKKVGTYKFQRAVAWTVEGGFSFWLGTRLYQYMAKQSEGAHNTVSKIPLCSGNSIIADGICDEWIDITTREIPKTFWKNLQRTDVSLNDERTWRSIAAFSNNCVKRRAYERVILTRSGGNEKSNPYVVASLPTAVPDDVLLTQAEIAKLVNDSVP